MGLSSGRKEGRLPSLGRFCRGFVPRRSIGHRQTIAPTTRVPNTFARAAIANPQYPTVPATVVTGVVLADCCSWREVQVRSIDSTPPRSRVDTAVVHHGMRREFIGFNRARHAVLEAAIYATRLHMLPRAFVESELARLQ